MFSMRNLKNQLPNPYKNLQNLFYLVMIFTSLTLVMSINSYGANDDKYAIGPYGGTCMIIEDKAEEEKGGALLSDDILQNLPSSNFAFREDGHIIDNELDEGLEDNDHQDIDNINDVDNNEESTSQNQSSNQDLGRLMGENNSQNNESNINVQPAEISDENNFEGNSNENSLDEINSLQSEQHDEILQDSTVLENHEEQSQGLEDIIHYLLDLINTL